MPMACLRRQAAAHTEPFVWISDDLLADCFDRYVRISRPWKAKSTSQRRHGSSIPGPLESHRRSAKRRLGYVAAIQETGTSFTVPTWFGFSRADPNAHLPLEQRWCWQPPNALGYGNNSILSSPASSETSRADVLKVPLEPKLEQPQDLVPTGPSEFQRRLRELPQDGQVLEMDTLEPVLQHLVASGVDDLTHNTVRFMHRFSKCKPSGAALTAVIDTVSARIKSSELAIEKLPAILCSLLAVVDKEAIYPGFANLLDCLTRDALESFSLRAIKTLLPSGKCTEIDLSPEARKSANLLLRYLQGCRELQGWHYSNRTWQQIYNALATRFADPASLADHLSGLQRSDLARILLRHWVPPLITRARDGSEVDTELTDYFAIRRVENRSQARRRPCVKNMMRHLETTLDLRYQSAGSATRQCSALVSLLNLLHYNRIPRQSLTKSIFKILRANGNPATEMALFNQVRHYKTGRKVRNLGIPHSLAVDMIDHFMATGNVGYARRVFSAVPSLPLSKCSKILVALIQEGKLESSNVIKMLWRQPSFDNMPIAERPVPAMNLGPAHLDIVHDVANAFAHSPHINTRIAFRRVYECYRFLRDRRAPIRPLLTRALVRSGIIRPLEEMCRVSTTKFRWVLSIVSAIEGQDIATTLDRVMYKLWRDKILPEIRLRRFHDAVLGKLKLEAKVNPQAFNFMWKLRTWARRNDTASIKRDTPALRTRTLPRIPRRKRIRCSGIARTR